jgi:hypothetical protein
MPSSERYDWDQQAGESDQAYRAFMYFRDQPDRPRTLGRAYALARPPGSISQTPGRWRHWSTHHNWRERAIAYDRHFAHVEIRAQEQAVRESVPQNAAERISWRNDIPKLEWESGRELIKKGLAVLEAMDPIETSLSQAVMAIDLGHKLLRMAGNMPPKVEGEAAPDFRDKFFDNDAQFEAHIGESLVPPMPENPDDPPPRTAPTEGDDNPVPTVPTRLRP